MTWKPNPKIGTCPCPMKGCGETAAVKKFRQRDETGARNRKAGMMYLDCPACGRIGFDAPARLQSYILENGEIWGARAEAAEKPERPAPAAKPAAAETAAEKPEKSATVAKPAERGKVAEKSAPAAKPAAEKRKGFWEW